MNAESIHQNAAAGGQPKTQPLDDKAKARLQKATSEFESIFVSYLLKGMRGNDSKDAMFGEDFGGDIMGSMFDAEMGKYISRNSNFGIGEMLYRKITGEPYPATVHHAPHQQPQPTPVAPTGSTIMERLRSYDALIEQAAEQHDVDANLVRAVIAVESGGHADARSSKDAKGLMQLVDSTAADMGVNRIWDPAENISGGAKYLKQLSDRFQGDLDLTLASYNAGPAAVEKFGGVPPFKETQDYVKKVTEYLQQFREQEQNDHADNQ